MFEVGKLTDESLDSFLGELEKASEYFAICSVTLSSCWYSSFCSAGKRRCYPFNDASVIGQTTNNRTTWHNIVTYVIDQSWDQKPELKEYHQLTWYNSHWPWRSEDDYRTGCRNVSHYQQQFYSGLRLTGRSYSTYLWNDSCVKIVSHCFVICS